MRMPVTIPVMSLPSFPVATMLWPSIPVAVADCWAERSSVDWLASSSSFSTMENWAVWAMNCVPSVGDMGFWYFIWATSSLRKVSLPISWGADVVVVVAGAVGAVTLLRGLTLLGAD